MIRLEIKKFIKNKSFLILLSLALCLTVYTNFFRVNIFDRQLNEGAEYDYVIDEIIMNQPNNPQYVSDEFMKYKWSGMSDEFNEDYQLLIEDLTNPFDLTEEELLYGFVYPDIDYKFIEDGKEFIDKYDLVLSDEQKDKLDYLDAVYGFVHNKGIDEEKFVNDNYGSSSNVLFTSLNIYYGLIPTLVFIFMFISSISYDYATTSINLFFLSPVKKRRYIISKLFSFLILVIFYSLAILFMSFLLGALRVDVSFILNYPIKLYNAGSLYIKFYQYILSTIGLFILNLAVLFSVLTLLFLLIKDNVITTIVSSAMIGLILIVTDLFNSLTNIYNPLYFNYPMYLLGEMSFDEHALDQANPYIFNKPSVSWKFIFSYLIIAFIILFISFYLINKEIQINVSKHDKNSNKLMSMFSFELYKSKKFINNKLTYGVGGLFLITMVLNVMIYIDNDGNDYFNRSLTNRTLTLSVENNREENFYGKYREENEKEFIESNSYLNEFNKIGKYYEEDKSEEFYRTYDYVLDYVSNLNKNNNVFVEDTVGINPLNLYNKDISEFSKQVNKEYRDILLKGDVKPLKTLYNRSLSWYDESTEPHFLEEGMRNQIPLDKSSFMILYRLIYVYNLPILIILLSIYLYGGNYNRDTEQSSSLEFIYLNPIDKAKYYDKKYLAGIFECIRYLFFCLAIVILIGLINDPKGTLNYPILRYIGLVSNPMENIDYSRYYEFISLKQYLFETSVLSLSLFLLIYTICHGLSIRAKSRYKVYGILSILIIALLLLAKNFPQLVYLNPAAYFKINDVVDGSIGIKEGYLSMTWSKGTIINIVLALLAYIIGRVRASKIF